MATDSVTENDGSTKADSENVTGAPGRSRNRNQMFPPIMDDRSWRSFCLAYGLTRRESDVLRLLCRGCSYEVIGEELGITRPTLRTHLRSAYAKTGCGSRVDLILEIVHNHRGRRD